MLPTEPQHAACPYCKATLSGDVVVCPACGRWLGDDRPKTQEPRPKAAPVMESLEDQQRKMNLLVGGVLLGVLGLCLVIFGGWWLFDRQAAEEKSSQSTQAAIQAIRTQTAQVVQAQNAYATRSALPTVQFQSTQTSAAASILATRSAESPEALLQRAALWNALFDDDFHISANGWYTGTDEDNLAKGTWAIEGGEYKISLLAKDVFTQWMWPVPNPDLPDEFLLSVRLKFSSGPPGMDGGVIFRLQEDGSFYLFDLLQSGEFTAYRHAPGAWETLIDTTSAGSYAAGESNLLEVVGQGSHYTFFLNGVVTGSFDDAVLSSGGGGIVVGLPAVGDEGIWLFQRYLVKIP